MTAKGYVTIDKELCKGCDLCVVVCPPSVLQLSDEYNSKGYHPVELIGECTGCELCFNVCPDFVFEVFRVRR